MGYKLGILNNFWVLYYSKKLLLGMICIYYYV